MSKNLRFGVLTGVLVPLVIWAGSATLPFTFTAGSLIKAAEINANFQALRDAINSGGSGTRLKVIAIKGVDGYRQDIPSYSLAQGLFTPLWDSTLGISCVPTKVPDAGLRCGPIFDKGLGLYVDAACTQAVATQEIQSVGELLAFLGGEPKPEPPSYGYDQSTGLFHKLGGEVGIAAYHKQLEADGGTTCSKSSFTRTGYQLGAVEPASTFAPLELGLQ